MKNYIIPILLITVISCNNGPAAKMKVFANGKLDKASTAGNIKIAEGRTYVEKEFEFDGKEPVKAVVAGKETTAAADGAGYYVWNLKKDTLIGSRQFLKEGNNESQTISQERLKFMIDSLNQLIAGRNINEANHNYMLEPGRFVKLTNSTDVFVVGPFNSLPAQLDEKKYSVNTEVYRFYLVKDIREQIARLQGLVAP